MKVTAVIILNYNNWEDTVACIKSVESYNTAPVKYIVVDNGSSREGTVQSLENSLKEMFGNRYHRYEEGAKISEPLPYVSFVVSATNDGYAQGNNKGCALAYQDNEIDYIMILNNDTLFIEDIIGGLVEAYRTLDKPALVGPLLLKKDLAGIDYNCARLASKPLQHAYWFFFFYIDPFGRKKKWQREQRLLQGHPELLDADSVECDLLSGACLLVSKTLFKRLDGFDPHTFLYNEENILYKRTAKLGLKTYVIPRLALIHLGASSTSKSPGLFIMRCSRDSTIYYIDKYSGANVFERAILHLAAWTILPKVRFQKLVFKILKIKK